MLSNKKLWLGALGLFLFAGAIWHDQYASGQTSQLAFKAVEDKKPRGKDNFAPPLPIALETVAAENARLVNNLVWTLGSKEQHGWFLYTPLIQRSIGTENNTDSSEFALSLAYWQQQRGFAPSGTLDEDTLNHIIEVWQKKRIANKEVAAPEKLFNAPITDFYDPTRDVNMLKVERETYLAYKRMVAEAVKDPTLNLKMSETNRNELAADEKRLKIISAFRSPEYQAKLRQASPNSSRTALALFSAHFTGRALDIYVGGEPVTTKDANRAFQINTPVYKWLVKNAERFGFYPYYYEPWHWEYVPENTKLGAAQTR